MLTSRYRLLCHTRLVHFQDPPWVRSHEKYCLCNDIMIHVGQAHYVIGRPTSLKDTTHQQSVWLWHTQGMLSHQKTKDIRWSCTLYWSVSNSPPKWLIKSPSLRSFSRHSIWASQVLLEPFISKPLAPPVCNELLVNLEVKIKTNQSNQESRQHFWRIQSTKCQMCCTCCYRCARLPATAAPASQF